MRSSANDLGGGLAQNHGHFGATSSRTPLGLSENYNPNTMAHGPLTSKFSNSALTKSTHKPSSANEPGAKQSSDQHHGEVITSTLPNKTVVTIKDIIEDRSIKKEFDNGTVMYKRYKRGHSLGKGGFAKCYELISMDSQKVYAGKIIPRASIAKPSAKKKFSNEIKIHRSINHPNVVHFERFFQDDLNYYILLELCPNQTLMDLVKARKTLTEPEVQYYMYQLVSTMHHLHSQYIIHRDLKLGNLFLSSNLDIRIGDFGLATRLEHPDERKQTICGTPNYIAPEIISKENLGHSFEVDTWALGVIMYTMLIGQPPFETESIETTYKKIREINYSFPTNCSISPEARSLISRILHVDPKQRPTMEHMLNDPFFFKSPIPKGLPLSCLKEPLVWDLNNLSPDDVQKVKRYVPPTPPASASSNFLQVPSQTANPAPVQTELAASALITVKEIPTSIIKSYSRNSLPTKKESPPRDQKNLDLERKPASPSHNTLAQSKMVLQKDSKNLSREKESDSKEPSSTSAPEATPLGITNAAYSASLQERLEKLNIRPKSALTTSAPITVTPAPTAYESLSLVKTSIPLSIAPSKPIDKAAILAKLPPIFHNVGPTKLTPPTVWVRQWIDCSEKYGLAYILSNGNFGMVYNDTSKLIVHSSAQSSLASNASATSVMSRDATGQVRSSTVYPSSSGSATQEDTQSSTDIIEYYELNSKLPRQPIEKLVYTSRNYPQSLNKKIYILKQTTSNLKENFNNAPFPLTSSQKEEPLLFSAANPNGDSEEDSETTPSLNMVYVNKFLRTKHALIFRLSNTTFQVIFVDRSELILNIENNSVTFSRYGKKEAYCLVPDLDTTGAPTGNHRPDFVKRYTYTIDLLLSISNKRDDKTAPVASK